MSVPTSPQTLVTYEYPPEAPASEHYRVQVSGREVFVVRTSTGDYACVSLAGPAEVTVEVAGEVAEVIARPVRLGIAPQVEGRRLRFGLTGPAHVCLEMPQRPRLFVFANPLEVDPPSPEDANVLYFQGCRYHDVGELRLQAGQTLYIEGGAIVRGCVRGTDAHGLTIRGRGVLDDSASRRHGPRRRGVLLERCDDLTMEGIVITEMAGWTVTLVACHRVEVSNLKQITHGGGSDGIDVVSCRDVHIADCMLCNGDDCIVVKAGLAGDLGDRCPDVDGVLVERCSLLAAGANAIEIGYELRAEHVRNIRFRDCDILGVHGHGAALSIHAGDRGHVSGVVYEDIRIEHYFNKLFDFRVLQSRWAKDAANGQVRDVVLRNIEVTESVYNPGYSVSLIGGLSAQHTVEGVVFDNVCIGGRRVLSADDLDLYCRNAAGVTFR